MGLLKGLLFVAEELARRAEDELNDEDGARAELVALYKSLESGAITEETFDRREAELLARLAEIAARKRGRRRPPG